MGSLYSASCGPKVLMPNDAVTSAFNQLPFQGQVANGPLTRYVKLRLRMQREYRERFPRRRFKRKPLVSYPGMYHGTCVTHVSWYMSGSLTRGGWENVIPGAFRHSWRMRNPQFTYLVRGPWVKGLGQRDLGLTWHGPQHIEYILPTFMHSISSAFSEINIIAFWLKFDWSLFLWSNTSALIQVITEPMLIHINETIWHH